MSRNACASTKAQVALKLQREESKLNLKSAMAIKKELASDYKYAMRVQKKKQKRKGR